MSLDSLRRSRLGARLIPPISARPDTRGTRKTLSSYNAAPSPERSRHALRFVPSTMDRNGQAHRLARAAFSFALPALFSDGLHPWPCGQIRD